MLFYPLEEHLYLPSGFVKLSDSDGRQCKVVGQEDKLPVLLGIVKAGSPKLFRIILLCVKAMQADSLIALQAVSFSIAWE